MTDKAQRGRVFYILLAAAIVLAGIIIGVGYYYISLNLWIHDVGPELEGYPYKLVAERRPMPDTDPSSDADVAAIDEVLIRDLSRDKIVMNLSRSEIRFGFLHHKAYVKVYLETAVPEKPEAKRVRVKLLEILIQQDGKWHLASTVNLLIQ